MSIVQSQPSRRTPGADWLVAGGELGNLIRAADWSTTSLGPREHWPHPLRTVLSLVVESRFPMALLWGPELLLLYNDACQPIIADKHPRALGRPTRESWPEIWSLIEPILAAVMDRGETCSFQDRHFPRIRQGALEDAWFTLCYSPIRMEDGTIGGTFVILQETTAAHERSRQLQEISARYTAIHDRAPFAIALVRVPEGTLVSVNEAFLHLFELTREEAIGKTSLELGIAVPQSRARAAEVMQRDGVVRDLTVTYQTKSGCPRILSLSANLVTIDEKDFVLTTAVDITERKQAEQALRASEERFRMVVEHSHDGINLLDLETGKYVFMSPGQVTLTGFTAEEMNNYSAEEAYARVHPDDVAISMEQQRQIAAGHDPGGIPAEYRWKIKSGEYRWFSDTRALVRNEEGRPVALVGVSRDITDRKQAEHALQEANARLIEADRHKNEFLAMLSHELRNPLAPIRNSLYILDRVAPASTQARQARAIIDRQIVHLTRMVDDLLDVTRLSSGKIQLRREPLDLNALVCSTVEDHRETFVQAGITLHTALAPTDVWVSGDRTRLVQVLGNLLHNAAKFCPRDGTTTVSVHVAAASPQAIVTVQDTGMGITPELLPRLFEPFTQADTTLARNTGGLGLGLALVKGLVEMHGGTVSAVSDGADQGATFSITLPLGENADEAGLSRGHHADGGGCRVLIIEDNLDATLSLRDALELTGHIVDIAYDGAQGLAKVHRQRPDVVLCDIGLPDMDGYAVARSIRGEPTLAQVVLVALSGHAQPEDIVRAREAGFDTHLAKPASIPEIMRVLGRVKREPGPWG